MLKAGDVLGYRALLSGDRYSASAVALEDTQVCFIPKDVFINVLQHDAGMAFEMMKVLSDELHRSEIKLTHLAQKPIRERLAETLLFIKETYGFEPDGITLAVKLSREEIIKEITPPDWIGLDYFAYPYGKYNQLVKDCVKELGFKEAYSVFQTDNDNLTIPRDYLCLQ